MSLKINYDKQVVDIEANGTFAIEVVGESNYSRALKYCYEDGDAQPKKAGSRAKIIVVELDLDDHNKHDKWAVAVNSRYGIIGYLSREMAVIYRQKYLGKQDLKVRALISSKDLDSGLFGVWLDLPIDSTKREPIPIPSAGGCIDWRKQTKSIRDKYEFSEKYDATSSGQGCAGCAGMFIVISGVLLLTIVVPVVGFLT